MRLSLLYILLVLSGISYLFISSCKSKSNQAKIEIPQMDSFANYPYWIAMMNDSNVNFYAAVEAFDKYWENREKPTEEDGEAKDIFGKEKSEQEKEKEANRTIEYVYEYKQFLHWKQSNQNLVKPDGTLLTAEEILEQWKKSVGDTL